jgi:hypothetical protein
MERKTPCAFAAVHHTSRYGPRIPSLTQCIMLCSALDIIWLPRDVVRSGVDSSCYFSSYKMISMFDEAYKTYNSGTGVVLPIVPEILVMCT